MWSDADLDGKVPSGSITLVVSDAAIARMITVVGNYRLCFVFFFQAEDGIRDYKVTGVQTCALPILLHELLMGSAHFRVGQCALRISISKRIGQALLPLWHVLPSENIEQFDGLQIRKIGRASCRERV